MAFELFKLSKLTITAFPTDKREAPLAGMRPFEVQYNPETLTMRHETVLQDHQPPGSTAANPRFSHSKSRSLNVALVLDGTHADTFGLERLGPLPTVADRIEAFLATCYQAQSKTHEPAYLRVAWGTRGVLGSDFDCLLQSADIKYTSFGRDGAPLHAEISAQFVGALDPKKQAAKNATTSPDLTHRRVVLAGDTLPLLCVEIYGSARHYLRVAEANRLGDFRRLQPGTELFFPPFERGGEA